MDKVPVVSYCLGLLGLLLLQGVLNVEGRSIFTPGNHVLNTKDDTDSQSKILALLLQKSLVPTEKDDPLGLELASKLTELEQVHVHLLLSAACFWKYCV
uniref:Urotensin 2B n=1 Tax=Echeneis naucrates TaxID=173247 RepID=A0A665WLD0_ECHNA